MGPLGVAHPRTWPDRFSYRVPHRDPRNRHRPPRLRRVRAVVRPGADARHRLPGGRSGRGSDRLRHVPLAGAWLPLRRTGHRGLPGHDRQREFPVRRHGRQHHEGEEAHQHSRLHRRGVGAADPAAPPVVGASAGVLPLRRMRRGDTRGCPTAQTGARPRRTRPRSRLPQASRLTSSVENLRRRGASRRRWRRTGRGGVWAGTQRGAAIAHGSPQTRYRCRAQQAEDDGE